MRRLALLGGAELTRGGVWDSQADEIWTLNWFYLYDWVPRIDRLFEMHPIWLYGNDDREEWIKPRKHWEWLQTADVDYPIYMLRDLPQVPNCVPYPLDWVSETLFGERLTKGQQRRDFFSSSFDYLMALAICEGWDVIELYGFEMGSDTEYRYQREGAAFFIGQAIARGIEVILPAKSVLLRSRKYGYEGAEMIYRQDIERIKDQWAERYKEQTALVQYFEGRMAERPNKKNAEALQKARDQSLIAFGGLHLVKYQLEFIDMEEPELEIPEAFGSVKVKG